MFRAMGIIRAMGLLAVLAIGCTGRHGIDSWSALLGQKTSSREQIVAGRFDIVADRTKSTLSRLGVAVAVRNGEEGVVHVEGVTKSGRQFDLTLTRVVEGDKEQTKVAIDWETTPDEAFWIELVGLILATRLPPTGV